MPDLEDGDPDGTLIPADIVTIAVPTPFSVGSVNAYLLEGDPLTLIDCGPATAGAFHALQDGLALRGHQLSDVEQIVLTHGHVDHAGLAGTLARRYGTRLSSLAPLADELADWRDHAVREDDYAAATLVRHGVAPQVVAAIHAAGGPIRGLSDPAIVARRLADGDRVRAGSRTLRVHHRPGHSLWDIVLADADDGVGFLGDHLLARTSSNATLYRPPDAKRTRITPLLDLRGSLIATDRLGLRLGLAGHGKAITDVSGLIARRLAQQERRASALEDLLHEHGPSDAHTLATLLLGERAITQALLAVSEVVGHLDLLIDAGTVAEREGAAACVFEAV